MIVLLDAGNSRYKWAKLSDGKPVHLGACDYNIRERAQAVIRTLETLDPDRIIAASVLDDDFNQQLNDWARSNYPVNLELIETRPSAHGVHIAYATPKNLGVDRFVALVGAHENIPTASIIVDCGTAVTIDALASSGEHRGGLILPGVELMRTSLVYDTKRIVVQKHSQEYPLFGRDTGDGVLSGTLRAVAAAVDRISADMEAELNEPVTRILCGGDAEQLIPWLDYEYLHEPLLIAKGLAVFAEHESG